MLLISANNLVTIYLGLELTSLSTYALVAFDRESKRGSEAAMKYFVLGSMASGMLLYGMSMIYGATGSMDLQQISVAISAVVFSVVGAFYYLRVVKLMYFDEPVTGSPIDAPVGFRAAISLNGIMMLGLGIFSSALITVCMSSFGA
jgi:NADH:ubiquinone oxidoreductase subunit 2 (subunit N)